MEIDHPEFVSIIIPVYNDSERLINTLKKIQDQTYPKNKMETIIIDNGANKNLKEKISQFKNIKLLNEIKPGAYIARNKGLMHTKGNIIVFTDSDCIPVKNWIENGVKALLKHPNCGIIGGEIKPIYRNPLKPNIYEIYDGLNFLPQKDFVEKQFAATANLFTSKKVVDEVGFFDEERHTIGDGDWGVRVYRKGYKIFYDPDTIVLHHCRNTLVSLIRRSLREANKPVQFLQQRPSSNETLYKIGLYILVSRPYKLNLKMKKKSLNQIIRSQVILLYFFLKGIQILEKLRILFGGNSFR